MSDEKQTILVSQRAETELGRLADHFTAKLEPHTLSKGNVVTGMVYFRRLEDVPEEVKQKIETLYIRADKEILILGRADKTIPIEIDRWTRGLLLKEAPDIDGEMGDVVEDLIQLIYIIEHLEDYEMKKTLMKFLKSAMLKAIIKVDFT